MVRGSFRTGNSVSSFSSGGSMSPYDNQANIYGELETEAVTADLVRLYPRRTESSKLGNYRRRVLG